MTKMVVGRMDMVKTQSVGSIVRSLRGTTLHTLKENTLKHVKRLKKLNLKRGDIVVVTLKGYPTFEAVERTRGVFDEMPFMKGVHIIIVSQDLIVKKSRPKSGKHKVELNNLEYLEYLSKRKGD